MILFYMNRLLKCPHYKRSRRLTSRRGWDHLRCGHCEEYSRKIADLRKNGGPEEELKKAIDQYADHNKRQYEHRQVGFDVLTSCITVTDAA